MITIDPRSIQDEGRFSRFGLISWWDQNRLRDARVLVVGAGALGNEIVKNCALLGIGNLLVADMDRVENSNLSRSVLFREADNGKPKAEAACRAARDIYPDIHARPFCGNAVHDLGLGAYFWADVVICGLDNREARVAVNSAAAFARKTWIDGAIEVLDGVARVFRPADGACYECTMNEQDWKNLESRRSCALLSRGEMIEGKVPTTPTTASLIASFQVQEAVKFLHGLETIAGRGYVFSGITGESYLVTYPRKPECAGHDACERLEFLGSRAADTTVGALLQRARADLGPDAVIDLSRDILAALSCRGCDERTWVYRSLGKVRESEALCPRCGRMRDAELLFTLGLEEDPENRTLQEIGVPPFDILTARSGDARISYLLDQDASEVLGDLRPMGG